MVRTCGVFGIFTSKCASCHKAGDVFNISTSKRALNPAVFNTFDFDMCFAPQRRALFHHLNFQKCEHGVFCAFEPRKCASRHSAVHFLNISTPKNDPRMICFVYFDLDMCFASQRRAILHLSSAQMAPRPPL